MAQDAPAPLGDTRVEPHPPQVAAVDARQAVVAREPLVHVRVVGREQVEDAAVLANQALDEELGLLPERLAQVLVELRKQQRVRHDALQIAQVEQLAREVANERLRAGIGQHPARLPAEHVRFVQPALLGEGEELLVRPARPQEVRQARRQLEVGQHVGGGRPDVDRIAFDPEQEVGRDQHPLERVLHAGVEAAAAAAGAVEVHQRREVPGSDGTAVGAPRQRGQDLPRAGLLVRRRRARGPAGEQGPPGRRVARTGAGVGTADGHVLDGRVAVPHLVDRPRQRCSGAAGARPRAP